MYGQRGIYALRSGKQALPHDVIAQHSSPPKGGFYPTSAWDLGEIVVDHYTLTLPPSEERGISPKGQYGINASFYRPQTGECLQRADGEGDLPKAKLTLLIIYLLLEGDALA